MSTRSLFPWAVCMALLGACAGVKQQAGGGPDAAAGAGGAGGQGAGATGTAGAGGTSIATGAGGDSGATGATGAGGTGGACVPSVVCTPPGGRYCGMIGNGCKGETLDCGTCPTGFMCDHGLCVGDATCAAATCGSYCGSIGDSCGQPSPAATARRGQQCNSGICAVPGLRPAHLQRDRHHPLLRHHRRRLRRHARLRRLPERRHLRRPGVANVCNDPTCKTVTCTPMGGQYCGTIGDGCGGIARLRRLHERHGLPDDRRLRPASARARRGPGRCRPPARARPRRRSAARSTTRRARSRSTTSSSTCRARRSTAIPEGVSLRPLQRAGVGPRRSRPRSPTPTATSRSPSSPSRRRRTCRSSCRSASGAARSRSPASRPASTTRSPTST